MFKKLGLLLCTAGLLAGCGQTPQQSVTLSGANPSAVPAGYTGVLPDGYAEMMQAMTIRPIPAPGRDIVVFNDTNIFTQTIPAMPSDPQNQKMFKNLVDYTTTGVRNSSKEVWIDRGHDGYNCLNFCGDADLDIFQTAITAAGYTPVFKYTNLGDLSTIPTSVKVLMLFMPQTPYDKTEINAMKKFASEGGRIVFIGEWDGFYGAAGIANQNDFLLKMGAVMTNVGNAVDCGQKTIPATSLKTHQVTTGLTSLQMACSSVIQPGPQDYVFMYDTTGKLALAGAARINTTPLP